MQSLSLQLPVSRARLCHATSQQIPYLTSTRAVRRAACIQRPARRLRAAANWKDHDNLSRVAVSSFDQSDTASWRETDDAACIAEQQALTRTRLQQLFTTQYDREIMAVLLPALLAIFLDPVMMLVDTGERRAWCLPPTAVLLV